MAFEQNKNYLKMTSPVHFCSGEFGALANDTSHSLPYFSGALFCSVYKSNMYPTRYPTQQTGIHDIQNGYNIYNISYDPIGNSVDRVDFLTIQHNESNSVKAVMSETTSTKQTIFFKYSLILTNILF